MSGPDSIPYLDSRPAVTVLDTTTGRTVTAAGHSPYEWTGGNWSCDCNRGDLFDADVSDDCGCRRFLVVAVEGDLCGMTLREWNDEYPAELLDRFLPPA